MKVLELVKFKPNLFILSMPEDVMKQFGFESGQKVTVDINPK